MADKLQKHPIIVIDRAGNVLKHEVNDQEVREISRCLNVETAIADPAGMTREGRFEVESRAGQPTSVSVNEPHSPASNDFYETFYALGGWKYSFWREYWWHRKQVVKRFGLYRGMRLLEAACGTGFHTNLFWWMGFDCVGLDRSPVGIEQARRQFPRRRFLCADACTPMPLLENNFDVVLTRGCSSYHYNLMDANALETTRCLLRFLVSGGRFVLIIVSDLSGRREPDKVWQNTLDDYRRHFASFAGDHTVDWVNGMAICSLVKV